MDAAPAAGYLDAVGGQPMLPAAVQAFTAASASGWADPLALHHHGRQARLLLDAARSSIAASLTALGEAPVSAGEVWFTSTVEAARQAILAAHPGPVQVGAVDPLALIEAVGDRGRLMPVDALGRVDLAAWAQGQHIDPRPGLATLQAANPEVGTVQPVRAAADLLDADRSTANRAHDISLLMDASQSVARCSLPNGWAAFTASATDWAGPAGVAVLVRRPHVACVGPRPGGSCWIDGTPNIAAAVAAAMALEAVVPHWLHEASRARAAIDAVRQAAGAVDDVEVLGDAEDRLPHVMTFSALYVSGEALVAALDRVGLSVASGSACLQDDRPSHVLASMGAFTGGNVRVSLPFGFAEADVERLIAAIPQVIDEVRREVLRGR